MSALVTTLALVIAAAGADGPAVGPVVQGAAGDTPVFTREEPHLAAGRRALLSDDVDTAIERYRRAATTTDTERAVVEYDVGQALTLRALAEARAQQAPPAGAAAGQPHDPNAAPPPPPNVDDALAAFDRAATLARDPRLVSEARLAAGNAALVGGKLDDAIAALRRSLVADPGNERARRNLQRALTMKQQQPPPPPQEGDGDKQDDDKQDADKKDADKKDADKQDADKKDADKKDADKKDDAGEKDADKQDADKKDADKKDADKQDADKQDADKQDADKQDADKQDDAGEKDGEAPQGEPKEAPQPVKPKPTSKEEARRLLQGLRSRERPLSPLEMRGVEKRTPAPAGKDW